MRQKPFRLLKLEGYEEQELHKKEETWLALNEELEAQGKQPISFEEYCKNDPIANPEEFKLRKNYWQSKRVGNEMQHSCETEVKPHNVTTKGKKYPKGRIQISVNPKDYQTLKVGSKIKVTITEPIKATSNDQIKLNFTLLNESINPQRREDAFATFDAKLEELFHKNQIKEIYGYVHAHLDPLLDVIDEISKTAEGAELLKKYRDTHYPEE